MEKFHPKNPAPRIFAAVQLPAGKKIYFASDLHLGAPDYDSSRAREKRFVRWLEMARKDAAEIYIVGDLFDFWFEYKKAVPRGFVRVLGKLAELTDGGLPVHLFTGNHDMWIFDYLPKETGVTLHRHPIEKEWNGTKFFIGHGDGLGPGDHGYKFIKKIFSNRFSQWAFARLHPNFGIGLADFFSKKSRQKTEIEDEKYLGDDKEFLVVFCKEMLQKRHFDYFVFGHRHLPLDMAVGENSRYINLGDWIRYNTYAVFDGAGVELREFADSSG